MPDSLSNQFVRSSGTAAPGGHIDAQDIISQLIVVTFEEAEQAQGLYEELVALEEKDIVNLEDAVFVSKNADGKLEVKETVHHEKKTGTVKGAVFGTLIGWMLGGPVLGLAGGAIVGRMIGKRMDLGIDQGTVDSISADLDQGHTALFVMGSARHRPSVIEAFSKFNGKIVETTVDSDARQRLQHALDSDNPQ